MTMSAESIFHEARAMAGPQRDAYLKGACGGDADLRSKVEALLRADSDVGSFLKEPTDGEAESDLQSAATDVSSVVEKPGHVIDRYKLLQQIGEGGFGVVYMAEQEQPVRRKVALKIIKLGMDTKQVIARFEAERQALAMMDHPNIAKVLDAGATETGRPYFVMELVKGEPITHYCDRQNLSVEDRLDLFQQTCKAVQHAHQKGIIHRDIKPSNVMITLHDGRPMPKVIDFGIAKATDHKLTEKTVFTEYRQFIGTPEYMSPEQAEMSSMDIDTRSDVYSLGVLLYELLTGTTPFDSASLRGAGYAEIQRIIREDTPHKPSTRLSTLDTLPSIAAQRKIEPKKLGLLIRGDLDWIVMKALEKDRTRRYETANGFAADIQRYLDSEPVVASPPSTAYRMRKFIRRNKAGVTAASLVAAALVLGVVGTTWGMVWALQEKERADTEATNAKLAAQAEQIARRDAEDAEELATQRAEGERIAKEQAERRLSQLAKGNGILASIFADLDPRSFTTDERPLAAILVENLGRAAEQLEGEAIGDPLLVAQMQVTLGTSLTSLGAADQAIPLLVNSLQTRLEQLGADHPLTLLSMQQLSVAYWEAGDQDSALPLAEETLERRSALFGPGHPATFTSMNNLAGVYTYLGQYDKSIPLFEELLQLQTAQLGRDHPETTAVISNLGMNYKNVGRLEEAIPLLEEAVELARSSHGPDHPNTLICMTNLAQAYHGAGKFDLAVPLYEETIERANATLGPDHPHTRKTVNSLANAYWTARLFTKSVAMYEDNYERLRAELGPDHPTTLEAAANLGANYSSVSRHEEAIALLMDTVPRARATLGPEHATTLLAISNLASAYVETGEFSRAMPLLEDALPLSESAHGRNHPGTLSILNSLGLAYLSQGQLDKSIPILEEILPLCDEKFGRNNQLTRQVVTNLGISYSNAGRSLDAIPLLEETLEQMMATLGRDHLRTLLSMHNLAVEYWTVGNADLAVPMAEETVQRRTVVLGPDHPDTLASSYNLTSMYRQTGQLDKSIPLYEEILEQRVATLGREHLDTISSITDLGMNYSIAGRFEDAIPLLEETYRASRVHPQFNFSGPVLLGAYVECAEPAVPENVNRIVVLASELIAAARAALPAESPELAGQLAVFGLAMLEAKAWDKAEPFIRESLAIREAKEPDDWRTFNTRSMLGGVLLGQNKYVEAEPLLLNGYEGMKEREATLPQLPLAQQRIPEALQRIIDLYTAWHEAEPDAGYDAIAEEWRARLDELNAADR